MGLRPSQPRSRWIGARRCASITASSQSVRNGGRRSAFVDTVGRRFRRTHEAPINTVLGPFTTNMNASTPSGASDGCITAETVIRAMRPVASADIIGPTAGHRSADSQRDPVQVIFAV